MIYMNVKEQFDKLFLCKKFSYKCCIRKYYYFTTKKQIMVDPYMEFCISKVSFEVTVQ